MVFPLPRQALSRLAAFCFGKLPTHGDFVARGLPAAERDAWDLWASEGLQSARDALGHAFPERHDVGRPIRFAFGPGPFGEGWRAGALSPSIDAAGRRFVVVVGARSTAPLAAPGAGEEVAAAAEDEIYRAFEHASTIDEMAASAQDVFDSLTFEDSFSGGARFWSSDSAFEIIAPQPPPDLLVRALST